MRRTRNRVAGEPGHRDQRELKMSAISYSVTVIPAATE
jgi:hypothetical protein